MNQVSLLASAFQITFLKLKDKVSVEIQIESTGDQADFGLPVDSLVAQGTSLFLVQPVPQDYRELVLESKYSWRSLLLVSV